MPCFWEFTTNTERISILKQNYQDGVEYEAKPLNERIKLDLDHGVVSRTHLMNLRRQVGYDDPATN